MSDEDIEEFAYEAGHFFLIQFGFASASMDWLRVFADKVAAAERNRTWTQKHWTEYERGIVAAEREACARMVEPLDESLADAIRARGEK